MRRYRGQHFRRHRAGWYTYDVPRPARWRRLIAPLLVMLLGLAICAYPFVSAFLYSWDVSHSVEAYNEQMKDVSQTQAQRELGRAHDFNRLIAPSGGAYGPREVSAEEERALAQLPYDDLLNFGDGLMGYIVIPSLNRTLPIFHGTEEALLQKGVGHLEGTSLPVGGSGSHAVLTGHSGLPSAPIFTGIGQLDEGELIYIKIFGETFAYRVTGHRKVLPEDTSGLDIKAGKDLLTLVTCTPYGINSHRLLVEAERVPYTESSCTAASCPFPWLLLLLTGLLAFLLGLLTGWLLWGRRRKDPEPFDAHDLVAGSATEWRRAD
ncbi:MAG: class C sortase [Coriobacteriaceae bacterium]|nr:class C sortase [Coriobacteriaceae bacterium]